MARYRHLGPLVDSALNRSDRKATHLPSKPPARIASTTKVQKRVMPPMGGAPLSSSEVTAVAPYVWARRDSDQISR